MNGYPKPAGALVPVVNDAVSASVMQKKHEEEGRRRPAKIIQFAPVLARKQARERRREMRALREMNRQ